MNSSKYPGLQINLRSHQGDAVKSLTYEDALQLTHERINASNYRAAAALGLEVIKMLPEDVEIKLQTAHALLLNNDPEAAWIHVERASELAPDLLQPDILKARIELTLGHADDARERLSILVSQNPEKTALGRELGDLLTAIGEIDEATAVYRTVLESNSRDMNCLYNLSRIPGFVPTDKELKQFEFYVASHQLPPQMRAFGHFALANIYNRKNNTKQYFFHLQAGNGIYEKFYGYRPDKFEKTIDDIITAFPASFFQGTGNREYANRKIIFIVGMPRSGSTLIEQILSSHELVGACGETPLLVNAVDDFCNRECPGHHYPAFVNSTDQAKLQQIARDYISRVDEISSAPYVTDKTLGNYHLIGLMHIIFPGAYFIHSRRHPVATCYGCYKNLFRYGNIQYAYSLDHLAATYKGYSRLMKHWETVLPGRIHNVQYESLVENQESVTRELLDYCDLPWDDGCLRFEQNDRTVMTSSNVQVRQGLFNSSLNKWREYLEYLGPLLTLEQD